jgi:uncharacterized protein YprB with RNaseH-like and TPR domain
MSMRSFRDRYGALESAVERETERSTSDWPVPSGGLLLSTSHGHTIVCDTTFHGSEIQLARERLTSANITTHIETTLFIDTETTGLAGGTGTHVFLVGLGSFIDGGFRVRQFFLRHPGEERALLAAVVAELDNSSCLVTYNGRSFDIPMLQTRFRMHHHQCPLPESHFDLLHTARAIWKHRLPSCSLGSVERDILGIARVDDAPGWAIPQIYFDYLQSRNVDTLSNVFNHNRQDIISLARIAALVHSYQTGNATPLHPTDRLCVALLQLRLGDIERALPVIVSESGSALIPSQLRHKAIRDVSTVLKRHRRFNDALELWERGLSDPSRAVRSFAAEELAKHLEHRTGDHDRALTLARRAADGARLVQDHQMANAFDRRVRRLEEKLRRASAGRFNDSDQELESV